MENPIQNTDFEILKDAGAIRIHAVEIVRHGATFQAYGHADFDQEIHLGDYNCNGGRISRAYGVGDLPAEATTVIQGLIREMQPRPDAQMQAELDRPAAVLMPYAPFIITLKAVLAAIEGAMSRLDHHIQEAILEGGDERADNLALVDLAQAKDLVQSALAKQDLRSQN